MGAPIAKAAVATFIAHSLLGLALSVSEVSGNYLSAAEARAGQQKAAESERSFLLHPSESGGAHGPSRWLAVAASSTSPSLGSPTAPLILAAHRTQRPDLLRGFSTYKGGWDVRNKHYWVSAGFAGAPGFIVGGVWALLGAGLLVLAFIRYCCCHSREKARRTRVWSKRAVSAFLLLLALSLILLTAGCGLLLWAEDALDSRLNDTLAIVKVQAHTVDVEIGAAVSFVQSTANTSIRSQHLSSSTTAQIDSSVLKLAAEGAKLVREVDRNEHNIRSVYADIKLLTTVFVCVALATGLLGTAVLLLGANVMPWIAAFSWFLVFSLWILCGTFLLLESVVGDTCVAMQEWSVHPQANSSLAAIVPCVSEADASSTLLQSREIANSIASLVNADLISLNRLANASAAGPLVPLLCSPYSSQPPYRGQACAPGLVSVGSAPAAWAQLVCNASQSDGLCPAGGGGRLTPAMYSDLLKAVGIITSTAHYGVFLFQLQSCHFVNVTVGLLESSQCAPLRARAAAAWVGLALTASGLLACVVLWVALAARRRHWKVREEEEEGGEEEGLGALGAREDLEASKPLSPVAASAKPPPVMAPPLVRASAAAPQSSEHGPAVPATIG